MPLERAEKRESTAIEVTCNTINDELIELFWLSFGLTKEAVMITAIVSDCLTNF